MSDFEQHRSYLWALAYRMLGSSADAEDIVQEAYLRARHAEPERERAYLSTIVTRLCLDHWKSARVKREQYVGTWLPEPVRTEQPVDPGSISLAFMVLLESLSPVERAVYLLSEVFAYSHAEIAQIIGASEASCRKQLQRAREQVIAQRPRFSPSRDQHDRLLQGFLFACAQGDVQGLERLLAEDVIALSDGGGKVHAAQVPVVGPKLVARLYTKLFRMAGGRSSAEIAQINGQAAVLVRLDGALASIIDIETDGDRIVRIHAIANPDKLACLIAS
jgi:RNA polymerase sigma-70 factor (ECF subfamily)